MTHARAAVVLCCVWLLPRGAVSFENTGGSDSRFTSLPGSAAFTDRIAAMAGNGFTGRITVGTRDAILYDEVIGDPGGDVFFVASIAKPFTAVAMLKLFASGAVHPGDRIGDLLPAWPDDDSTTVHHLLSHTSGLAQGYAAEAILDTEAAVASIFRTTRRFAPGQRFGYANENYVLAAIVIERASGQGFVSFLRENVLQPAGLVLTRYWDEPAPEGSRMADLLSPFTDIQPSAWGFRGANGLVSNSFELVRWLQALLAGRILPIDRVQEFLEDQVTIRDTLRGTYGGFVSDSEAGTPTYWIRGTDSSGANAIGVHYQRENLILAMTTAAGPAEGGLLPYYNVQIRAAFEETIIQSMASRDSG